MSDCFVSNKILKVILEGLYDEDCPLSKLRGCYHVLKFIWSDVRDYWKAKVCLPWEDEERRKDKGYLFCSAIIHLDYDLDPEGIKNYLKFPEPTGINIKMMPFLVGKTLKECHLPDFVRPYWKLIDLCLNNHTSQAHHYKQAPNPDDGKVYFLTIEEGVPGPSNCGIHFLNQTEHISHSLERISQGKGKLDIAGADGSVEYSLTSSGGAFIASTVPDSIRVWDCSVDIDFPKGGDIEYLRWALPKEIEGMSPGEVFWITDRTPVEDISTDGGERQFFQIVTSEVSLWLQDYYTENPLAITPDPEITKTI